MLPPLSILFSLLLLFSLPSVSSLNELPTLMAMKASLDPQNQFLTSWTPHSDPCSGAFEGVACNEQGRVVNISLQGKGLMGQIPGAVADLKSLTGLYLHFNALNGKIPKEITSLNELADLYLNVNNLSGEIPPGIGNMPNLQGRSFSFWDLFKISSCSWKVAIFSLVCARKWESCVLAFVGVYEKESEPNASIKFATFARVCAHSFCESHWLHSC